MVAKSPYEQIQRDYCQALEWIEQFAKVKPYSRLGKYTRDLEKIISFKRDGGERNFEVEDFELVESTYEIAKIIKIHQNLVHFSGPGLGKRLRDLVGGPPGYTDENPGSSSIVSRNTQFELYVAAELASDGINVSLDHETADIVFDLEGVRFFIECKRPQSARALPKCFKDAQTQLEKRYALQGPNRDSFGLIGICGDRLVNQDFDIMTIKSDEEVNRSLNHMLDILIESYSPETNQHLSRDFRTLGAIYFASVPTLVIPPGMLTYSETRRVQHFQPDEYSSQLAILNGLLARIQRGISADFERRFKE